MLYKSKINISVILLAIGIGLIPTGFITNGFIRDQIGENIPSTILHIQEEAISEIEAQYLGLGITEVLPRIKDQETENIKDEIVEVSFIPSTLLYLKNLTAPLLLERLNGSMTANLISDSLEVVYDDILANINGPLSAQIINETLEEVIANYSTTAAIAKDVFFNNYTFQVSYENASVNGTTIKGVSEYASGSAYSLNFTVNAQQSLLYGNLSYPGLIEDIVNGTGILEFIELYENATIDPITYNITTIETAYNSTWGQLTYLKNYVSDYLWASIIPQTWNNTITPSAYASTRSKELFFNDESWSSTTKSLTPVQGISEYGTGGSSNISYSTTAQQRILYGYGDSPGILDNLLLGQGVWDYLEYFAETLGNETIQSQYNASNFQLTNLTIYLTQYIMEVIIPAQLAFEGLTLETAGLRDFYIQWANASLFTSGISINELSDEIGDLLKARSAANEIKREIISLLSTHNETVARDLFFNNYTFQVNFSTTIKGVSEYNSSGYSLNYTTTAQQRILDGYKDAPGIFTEIKSGFGLLNWLDFYDSALLDIGSNRTLMETTYNATWSTQLLPFGQYLWNYLLGTIIATISQRGLEAGIPTATNILYNTTVSLWDTMNPNGIVNDTGILKWYKAAKGNTTIQNQLEITFDLTTAQFDQLKNWILDEAKSTLTPTVFIVQQPLGIRLTTSEYAGILFLEQWANVTVIPSRIDLGNGIKGFEVGFPVKSNISYVTAAALFDIDNSSSFIDNIGILKWIDAYNGDLVAKNELIPLFGLDSNQMDLTLTWLFSSFKTNVLPNVLTALTGQTTISLAEKEFHRQWTNGTLFGNGIDLDPAFGLNSITDWEIGIPVKRNIDQETSVKLWDEENSYSLVHQKGNGLWFRASFDPSAYDSLKEYHELYDTQMDAIIAWIEGIREDYSLPHLKEKLNLPFDVYTYANTVFLGFIISGAIFLALGCIYVILISLTKRRQ